MPSSLPCLIPHSVVLLTNCCFSSFVNNSGDFAAFVTKGSNILLTKPLAIPACCFSAKVWAAEVAPVSAVLAWDLADDILGAAVCSYTSVSACCFLTANGLICCACLYACAEVATFIKSPNVICAGGFKLPITLASNPAILFS